MGDGRIEWMDVGMGGWMFVWMGGDGWMDGCVDIWMGWINAYGFDLKSA